MMREIDTEQPVVWPEWCYNTTGESRSAASPSTAASSGDQKGGCGLATMSHSSNSNGGGNPHSGASLPPPSGSAANGSLVNALNTHSGLSFLTSQMAMSANKLLQMAQKHQQQQNYRPPPQLTNNGNQQPQHHQHLGVKRKHLDSAVALLSDRLSPAGGGGGHNNNSFSVNNLNLEKLAQRIQSGQSAEEQSLLPKNLAAKDLSSSRASPPAAIKSERISPINFHNGSTPTGGGRGSNGRNGATGRSRSSTPSSSAVVFHSSPSAVANNGSSNSNGTPGLIGNGTGHQQHQQQSHRNGSELSLSRPSHHQLSNHHQPTYGQPLPPESRSLHGTESLQRPGEPQARNYSDMIRSLAAKYNSSSSSGNDHNGHLISSLPAGASASSTPCSGGQTAGQQRFSSSSSNNKMSKEPETSTMSAAAAMRLLSSGHNGKGGGVGGPRSRSPVVQKATSLNNPSLAASLSAASHEHSTAAPSTGPSSLISSFLTGLPASMFTPMIDMSSTQALVTLARAAKEAEFLNLLSSAPSPSSSTAAATAASTSGVSSATSSSSSVSSPRTNGNSASAARKRLQATRSVFNATTATNQKGSTSRVNPLLGNVGGYADMAAPPPTGPLAAPHAASFSASLFAAAAAAASNNGHQTKGRSSMDHSAPLDLSAGPTVQPQGSEETEEEERPMKKIKIEHQMSPSFSPGPDSGIGEMITMNGGRDVSGGSSSESESPVRRSEASPSPRQSMEKWGAGCNHQADMEEMRSWSVQQVSQFVATIDICAEYAQAFQEQSIDGTGLPLLTEEHLRNLLSMKLGPALKLKAILAARMGLQCTKCGGQNAANMVTSAASPSPSETRRMSQGGAPSASSGNRRSVSPPAKLSSEPPSFSAFRTKMESLSPSYSSGGEGTNGAPCEGMIAATVTMTAAPGGRSTPIENGARDESSTTGNDIPMKLDIVSGAADR